MGSQEVSALLALCKTGSAEEQRGAIIALEELLAREAVPVLLSLLSSPDEGVRANIAVALGKLGSCDEVMPALLALAQDESALVRVNALQALGDLGCAESAVLLRQLLVGDPDPLVRLLAAETLGVLGDRQALSSLVSALGDADEGVRSYAAAALGRMGEHTAMPAVRAHLALEQSTPVKASLLGALYQLGDDEALAPLLALADEVDSQTAATVLNVAAALSSVRHKPMLRSRLEAISRTRPELAAEVESLLQRLESNPDLL